MGQSFGTVIFSDASAALGVVQRQGLGRLRHVDCSFLFVQSLSARKVAQFSKVPGRDNPADICTKGIGAEIIARHVKTVGGRPCSGRPVKCPSIMPFSHVVTDSVNSLNRTHSLRDKSEGGCETIVRHKGVQSQRKDSSSQTVSGVLRPSWLKL